MNNSLSLQEYENMTKSESCHPDVWSNLGCCYFMLGLYDEAKAAAGNGRGIEGGSVWLGFNLSKSPSS